MIALNSRSVGGVAQLGERRVRNAEVVSSILILSTNQFAVVPDQLHAAFSPIPPEAGLGENLRLRTSPSKRAKCTIRPGRSRHGRTMPRARLAG